MRAWTAELSPESFKALTLSITLPFEKSINTLTQLSTQLDLFPNEPPITRLQNPFTVLVSQ